MVLLVTPNPCIDKTVYLPYFEEGRIIRSDRYTMIPGGKGNNAARVLKQLGIVPKTINILGGENGRLVQRLIARQDGIETIPVWVEGMTREIMTIFNRKNQIQTAFVEPGSAVTEDEAASFMDIFNSAIPGTSFLAICGSSPHKCMDNAFFSMVETAKLTGIPILLDSRGNGLKAGLQAGPDIIKPNIAESSEFLGWPIENGSDILECITEFRKYGVTTIFITAGEKGFYAYLNGRYYFVRPPEIPEVNPIGSGDAMTAAVIYCLLNGYTDETALRWASAAGAANAAVWDACYCTEKDIRNLLNKVSIKELMR